MAPARAVVRFLNCKAYPIKLPSLLLDGRGYPDGVGAEQLSVETRIITTADVFDALTADRPYRKAMRVEKAMEIMEKDRGTAIDPDCLDALRRIIDRQAAAETAGHQASLSVYV